MPAIETFLGSNMQRILRHPYLLLALTAFMIYVSFMSIGLDYFDSHTFALVIDDPDIGLAEVHSFGFPVYLFIAKLIQLIVGDTQLALTLVSSISGALGIACVAKIGSLAGGRKAGFISAGLLLFLPGYWINSGVALSDIPGNSLTLLAVYLFFRAEKKRAALDFVAACFVTGLQLGVRPHNAIPIVIAAMWAIVKMRRFRREYFHTVAVGIVAGILAISISFMPILSAFDGFDGFVNHLTNLREHVHASDSLFQSEINSQTLSLRVQAYLDGWMHLLAGGDARAFILILMLLIVGLIKVPINSQYTWLFIVWFVVEAGKVFLLASLARHRLFLPALAPLLLLAGLGYARWRGRFKLVRGGVIPLIVALLWQALPLVAGLTRIPPPPEQATSYILEHYPQAEDALVVSQGSFRASQYHLKDYRLLYSLYISPDKLAQIIASDQPQYVIVLDAENYAPELFSALNSDLGLVKVDDLLFERDARIFPQHASVSLQVYAPAQSLESDSVLLAGLKLESRQLEVGNPRDGMYFSNGWYATENIGGVQSRWASQKAVIRLRLEPRDTRMRFVASPYLEGQTVTISVNNEVVDTVAINEVWSDYEVLIPADAIRASINTISLDHARAEYPDNHHRRLAAAYRFFYFD